MAVELDPDGGLTVYGAVADPGEGNDSMLTQLTADAMGMPMDMIRLVTRDTDHTTANGPAAASRITYMAGGAMLNALAAAEGGHGGARARRPATSSKRPDRRRATWAPRRPCLAGPLDPKTGQGPSFESQVHAVQLAEVEVDTETGEVTRPEDDHRGRRRGPSSIPLTSPASSRAGWTWASGYALREEYVAGETKDWVSFKLPDHAHGFDMDIIIRETPRKHGARGAVGVGEMTMVPTAPAVINAIDDASRGVGDCDLPATPDKVKAALAAAR